MENIEEEDDEQDQADVQKFKDAFQSKKQEGQKIQKDFDLNLRTAKGKNVGPSFEQVTMIEDEKEEPLISVDPPEDLTLDIDGGDKK